MINQTQQIKRIKLRIYISLSHNHFYHLNNEHKEKNPQIGFEPSIEINYYFIRYSD